jgi:hypothetical protein
LWFCLLSRSEELVGFRRGDYKLKGALADNEKPTVFKTRLPCQLVQGGEEIQPGKGSRGVKIKIGIAVANHSYPSTSYYFKCAGFNGRLIVAFQPLKILSR